MAVKELLKTRTQIKKRKPTYKRVQSHQFAKLKDTKWRRPKGMGNKVRRNRRGKPSMPEVGFGSPKEVRGLNKDGFKEIIISSFSDLEKLDSKTQIGVIGKTVGAKKRLDILNKAKELKVEIGNVSNIDSKIKDLTKEKKTKTKKVEAKKSESKDDMKAETKDAKQKASSSKEGDNK